MELDLSRRDMLKVAGFSALGMAVLGAPLGGTLGGALQGKEASELRDQHFPKRFATAFVKPPVLRPYQITTDADGAPLHKYEVVQQVGSAGIVGGGLSTTLLGYSGIFPGPTIDVDQGTRISLRVRNKLPLVHPEWGYPLDTSTHLHGSASLPQFDGYANDLTHVGYKKYYQYPNFQPARTLWYHDHAVHNTAQNAYSGLAAQYHLHDPAERELLPQGDFDVPLTVTDAMFARNGNLAWDDNSHSGLWGDVILVNGAPWPVMKVQRRVYRFRVLNASISRSYNFRLSTRDAVTVVATDGGLLPVAKQVTSWRHAGAERYEVLIDFSKYKAGTSVELQNTSNKNNVDYDYTGKIMRFDVTDAPVTTTRPDGSPDPSWNRVPTTLVDSDVMALKASQAKKTRRMRLKKNDAGIWTLGDHSWQEIVDSGFTKNVANPALDDVEIWEFENSSGGWFHPVHVHLVDFQILARNGRAPFEYEKGPKDVVYVGEGETVRVLMKFGPHRGRYMIHCHNLPHEDHDMMTQFIVGMAPGDPDVNDPIEAAPCIDDDDTSQDD
ncbi:multicopper oxidase family protein [Georgenia yuyongxinii]|nr:multicopper oxidase domain-containing protein [Georgenia yuyongxinii]